MDAARCHRPFSFPAVQPHLLSPARAAGGGPGAVEFRTRGGYGSRMIPARATAVLEYWFGEQSLTPDYFQARNKMWFMGGAEVDAQIRAEFQVDVEQAASGALDAWSETRLGSLALILLLDQFAANIYRGDARGYLYSDQALPLSRSLVTTLGYRELTLAERIFVFMPLEHAESLDDQRLSVALFTELRDEAPLAVREEMEGTLDYAVRHLRVVERFGRFPHRNAVHGRPTTEAEAAFLASPEAPF